MKYQTAISFIAAFASGQAAVYRSKQVSNQMSGSQVNPLPPMSGSAPNVYQMIQSASQLSIFSSIVSRIPSIRDVLVGNVTQFAGQTFQQISVFAPTNQAFMNLPPQLQNVFNQTSLITMPSANKSVSTYRDPTEIIESMLAYHIVPYALNVSTNAANQTVTTLLNPLNLTIWSGSNVQVPHPQSGNTISIPNAQSFNTPNEYVNEALILQGFNANNGELYVIDTVVSPLWYLNISLAQLPSTFSLPNLIQIAGY